MSSYYPSLIEYKYSEQFPEGITCILYTLNSAKNINGVLKSLLLSGYDQLIVVDGGSTDGTIEEALKYPIELVRSAPGIITQFKSALIRVKYKYVISLEVDHRYPSEFCQQMKLQFFKSEYIAMQARLVVLLKNNYWEKGLDVFYRIHHSQVGHKDMIAGPDITYTEYSQQVAMELDEVGMASDTTINDIHKKNKFLVGLSNIHAFQYEPLNFNVFCAKYFKYGVGDYYYYEKNKQNWKLTRKVKSILHIFYTYVYRFPMECIKKNELLFIPYFVISAVIRYSGWVYSKLIHANK